MASDRLKEISDYVDSIFIERNRNIVEVEVDDHTDTILHQPNDEDINKPVVEGQFIRLMRRIETNIYFKHKSNMNPNNFKMKSLYFGFIYSLFKMSGYSKEITKLAYDNISYFNEIDEFLLNTYGNDVRKYTKNIMKEFNIKPIIKDTETIMIPENQQASELSITPELINIINKEPNKIYPIEKLTVYKNKVVDLKKNINEICNTILDYLNNKEHDKITFFNDCIDIKNYKIQIINNLLGKLNKIIKCICRFNIPELMIYNKLVELKSENGNILYILNNYKLPVSRNYKNVNNLIADFLILYNFNNKLQFSVIEYDGPSHYNTNYYMFTESIVYCDIVKNNFCKLNNINMLRVRDTNKQFLDTVTTFIKSILVSNNIFIIPKYIEYMELINNII